MISIGANGFQLLMNYIVAIIVAIVLSLILKLPILPEKPIRFSWTKSAIFPTTIIAMGLLAFCFSINFYYLYDGKLLAVLMGIIAAIFVQYLFNYVFPDIPNSKGDMGE